MLMFCSIGMSQDSGNAAADINCEAKARESKDTQEATSQWKVIKFRSLEFAVPKHFEVQNANCFDGLCLNYRRSNFELSVDPTSAAWRPVFERITEAEETEYSERIRVTEDARYWSWNMKNDGEFLYKAGVVVWDEARKKYVGGIYFGYNCIEDARTIEKIIDTVRLISKNDSYVK